MDKIVRSIRYYFLFVTLISLKATAQEIEIIRPGLIRAQATISPSLMFSTSESHFYLHGNIEGYIHKNISLAGEAYYYLGNLSSEESLFQLNHSIHFGSSWHFTKKNNDLYIGIQPGISITKLNNFRLPIERSLGINPIFSSVIGYQYYVNNFFHFFIQTRLIIGNHNYDIHAKLNELRFSAGLGFNIHTIK